MDEDLELEVAEALASCTRINSGPHALVSVPGFGDVIFRLGQVWINYTPGYRDFWYPYNYYRVRGGYNSCTTLEKAIRKFLRDTRK